MSEQQERKKELEALSLEQFIDAYKYVTNEQLLVDEARENPDFLCRFNNDDLVGVELAKIMRDPRDAIHEEIVDKHEEMGVYETMELIQNFIERKEKARKDRYIKSVDETIHVLELVDGSLDSYRWYLDDLKGDFCNHGFLEIWLADYTELDAYGDIELFGLYPDKWWGYHQRVNPGRKPYG